MVQLEISTSMCIEVEKAEAIADGRSETSWGMTRSCGHVVKSTSSRSKEPVDIKSHCRPLLFDKRRATSSECWRCSLQDLVSCSTGIHSSYRLDSHLQVILKMKSTILGLTWRLLLLILNHYNWCWWTASHNTFSFLIALQLFFIVLSGFGDEGLFNERLRRDQKWSRWLILWEEQLPS